MIRSALKSALWAALVVLLPSVCLASDITGVRHSVSEEKIRIVIELSEEVPYQMSHEGGVFTLSISSAKLAAAAGCPSITDPSVKTLTLLEEGGSVKVTAGVDQSLESKVFSLKEPDRIVIDLIRPASGTGILPPPAAVPAPIKTRAAARDKKLRQTGNITKGLSLFNIEEIVHNSLITGKALLVDMKELDVMPVMAISQLKPKESGDAFGSLLSFFGFEPEKETKYSHFARRTVSGFLKMYDGLAGVNGSFFFADGTPVGTLIINKQIVSSPLFNRTSLIFYENGTAAIDSVRMAGYLRLSSGKQLSISGINQPMNGGIIVYTPDYQRTGYSGSSVNISVVGGKAEQVSYGEIDIPKNGFVVSAAGSSAKVLTNNIKPGDSVEWFFMTRPAMKEMKHIVAGGPRLVHSGNPCVTSREENFRSDVARSRANRTGAGITKSGELILLTVERATLNELARLMIELGAYDAMNLDGGGSSGLAAEGRTLFGGMRPVPNAIIVRRKGSSVL